MLQHGNQSSTIINKGWLCVACLQEDVVERVPFLLLGMELPPTPLFKDALEKNIIPQVRLSCFLAIWDVA